jgi:isoquinoline 1-oxidoreductase subunit beta
MNTTISRRSFLKGSLAAGGLTIAVSVTPFGYKLLNAAEMKGGVSAFKPNAWFEITPDNVVTVWVSKSEMGQGAHTALPMLVADELEASWKQIRVKQAPAAKEYACRVMDMQITVASASCRGYYEPLRKAGAAGRAMLITAAAKTWNVPESECKAELGKVMHTKSKKSLTYGQLCEKAAKLQVPENPPLKKESEFRYIGKPMPRVDIPDKVSGKAVFGMDVQVPGMLYAALVRPPAYGAKPISQDQSAAEGVKGVRKIVPTPNGIAVVAESIEAAWKGRDALNVKWDKGSHPDMNTESVEKYFREALDKPGVKVTSRGDAAKGLAEAAKKVEAVYYAPHVAHVTMEPMNCTAYVRGDRCDVWAPTQGQTIAQIVASKVSGLTPDKVNIHTTLLGCGFGRRSDPGFVVEAVLASKAVGKPVKVIWTREEDIKYDLFRAATCQRIQAGLDGQGRLTGWSHKVACTSILRTLNPQGIKNGVDSYCLWGIYDYPESPHVNNFTMYDIPDFYLEEFLSELPIPGYPWRSVSNAPNAFIMESFVDELAHVTGKDPLKFRLELLKDNKRPKRVLETVAEKAGWGETVPKGMGRGIAQHACFGSYVAQVADLSVNKSDGTIKVHKIVCAVDCGPVVNPGPLVAQIEGAITMGLSASLKEEVKFANGGVESANFEDYDILRMSETPEIEVHVVKNNDRIGGIGEPAVTPVAPAVANAFFNATGVRMRRLPLTPKFVLEALKKA